MGIKVSSHSGHRERVRYVVEHNGLRYLPPYQVLEFLLFYGIPYKDTKPIAYELLSKFGTLKNVFLADVKELMQVKNMTRNAALLLKSYGEIHDFVFKAELSEKTVLGPNNVLSYLRDLFSEDLTEKLVIISLNEKKRTDKLRHARLRHARFYRYPRERFGGDSVKKQRQERYSRP